MHPVTMHVVKRLKQMSVHSKLSIDMSRELLVNSCNLQLGKTIGQGKMFIVIHPQFDCITVAIFFSTGEFGIVYRGLLKKSFTEGFSKTVAVKTLKGYDTFTKHKLCLPLSVCVCGCIPPVNNQVMVAIHLWRSFDTAYVLKEMMHSLYSIIMVIGLSQLE